MSSKRLCRMSESPVPVQARSGPPILGYLWSTTREMVDGSLTPFDLIRLCGIGAPRSLFLFYNLQLF